MTTLPFLKYQIISLFILLSCSIPVGYSAEKALYFLGGGGEPKGPTTIFDGHMRTISQFVNQNTGRWTSSHSFNGGHEKTEKELQANFKSSRSLGNFTEPNVLNAIREMELKIESGKLKSGDQLLLVLDTHGATKEKNEKTHSISFSFGEARDLKTLSGASTISMDRLAKLSFLASEKGVKLAIVDLSCFSGNSLALANKNTCVISASGANHFSYVESKGPYKTFGGRFLEAMKPGSNLEDIFLKARVDSTYADFPSISTENGLMVNDHIYKIISPYLLFNRAKKITDFSSCYDVANVDTVFCKTNNQYFEVLKKLDEIKNIGFSIPKKLLDTTQLKKALSDYRIYQLNYEKALKANLKVGLEIKAIIRRDYPDKARLFDSEDGVSIVTANRKEALLMYRDLVLETKDKEVKKVYLAVYNDLLLRNRIAREARLKLSTESQRNIINFQQNFQNLNTTEKLAEKVAIEAKKVYDKLYRANINIKKNNPCKDFVL